jgi:DNA-binding GntR family transcriptional regulator
VRRTIAGAAGNLAPIDTKVVDEAAATGHGGAVARAATVIRESVLRRVFLPGEQVRQEDLAQKLGLSRGPIREALQVLAGEGVLRYEQNRGYFVTRFTSGEMEQLYLIRDLLESQILANLPPAPKETVARLKEINAGIRAEAADLQSVIQLNREFHALLFRSSDMHILTAELEHIGRMTMAYQSLSVNALHGWELVAADHDRIIAALEARDNSLLVRIQREHRDTSLRRLVPILD